jgi:aryl-alcohol dehydrogenase (NADP+)
MTVAERRRLGSSEVEVFPLCLGGNVFGWTANEAQSFEVLDRYVEAGGNFIDTADVYPAWAPGNSGGESEAIIGRWFASRGKRDRVVIATKVGMFAGLTGLSAKTITAAADASLKRLQTGYIDLYYAHKDDPATPLVETLGAFDKLVKAGKVRAIGASNYTAPRLAQALAVSKRLGLARFVALQPHYNLVHREEYEGPLADLCVLERLACLPYFSLAKGFLTGKYRPGKLSMESPRAIGAREYMDERGLKVLAALEEIAAAHRVPIAAVALAWLAAQPAVVAPIASARSPEQLAELLPAVRLGLRPDEVARLAAI